MRRWYISLTGALVFAALLAACTGPPWKQAPDIQAAQAACAGLPEAERYACIERHATERLNPDVCRLAGMWVDDMCLQAVYEAAGDPTICDRLYLEGMRPTCRAYYASLEMAATPPGTPLALTETYTDPLLGLAVDYPAGWQVDAVVDAFVHFSAPAPSTSTVGIVRYPQPTDATLDTVLDDVLQGSEGPRATRPQTLTVGGQPAIQVFFGPHEDGRPDTVVLVADPAGEWWTLWTLGGYGELAIFDQIVGTLRWLPRSLPGPTTTPAGTPVASSMLFTVCQSSDTWTRPGEAEQATQVWDVSRRQGIPREMLWWIFQQSFYRYGGGNSEMFDMWPELGLWTARDPYICKGDRIGGIVTGREIELWILLHRVVAARRQGDVYTVTVEPTAAGYQIVHLPGPGPITPINVRSPLVPVTLRFVDTEGREIDHLPKFPPWADPGAPTTHDVVKITEAVMNNALSAQTVTLEDVNGATWCLPWMDATIVRQADGTPAQFRDIARGMALDVAGFRRTQATMPNVLSAVRVTILDPAPAPQVD